MAAAIVLFKLFIFSSSRVMLSKVYSSIFFGVVQFGKVFVLTISLISQVDLIASSYDSVVTPCCKFVEDCHVIDYLFSICNYKVDFIVGSTTRAFPHPSSVLFFENTLEEKSFRPDVPKFSSVLSYQFSSLFWQ